ncbi:MAG: SDR family oxidoreductase [Burkholderiales bacterium]|nr:SDR family oxidoreductase [Burkholderiales bacterium]
MQNEHTGRPAAIVTGATYGIGAATALALARAGFDLALCDLDPRTLEATEALARGAGARVARIALDLRSQASIVSAVAAAAAFGHLEVLVNNAGVPLPGPALEATRADWSTVMSVNLEGTFFMTQAMGRHLTAARRPGAIVSIASTHGLVGHAGQALYGISKAGIAQMTRMLAIEWAAHGIRVNAVAPGKIDTVSPARQASMADPARRAGMLARIPLGRFGTVEEVAALVCYLAGTGASYATGQVIALDGGVTAQ